MGLIVSFDEQSRMPASEIKLDSGEHVLLTLERNGLVIKTPPGAGRDERVLFEGSPEVVARICTALHQDVAKVTPLRILVSAVTQMPNAAAVETAFQAAAAAT